MVAAAMGLAGQYIVVNFVAGTGGTSLDVLSPANAHKQCIALVDSGYAALGGLNGVHGLLLTGPQLKGRGSPVTRV